MNDKTGGSAFPRNVLDHSHGTYARPENGMTLRQYAAIKLKVPDSGTDWLDDMIRESLRDDLATKIIQAYITRETNNSCVFSSEYVKWGYKEADAMLEARGNK